MSERREIEKESVREADREIIIKVFVDEQYTTINVLRTRYLAIIFKYFNKISSKYIYIYINFNKMLNLLQGSFKSH